MVRQVPVKASVYTTLPTDVQLMLLHNGAVPVNDVFFELWYSLAKIWLLYGGWGSGKSVFIADKLIDKCLNNKYFKCLYGRKIKDDVRESVFATICDRIEERGLQEHFTYSRADNSSMYIRCVHNKNVFIPFGADKINKLKSIKDPTDIFCEELDQFDQKDFEVLYGRLRKKGVHLLFIGAFNTEKVFIDHWIRNFFFPDEAKITPADPRYKFLQETTKLFCNYSDNYFLDRKTYEETLWISAAFSETKFRQISGGDWGSSDIENLWAYAFRRSKHVIDVSTPEGAAFMAIDDRLPVYLVFDFNVDPITCLVCQKNGIQWSKIIKEYRLRNSDIFELCDRIRTELGNYFLVATGDASGRNRDANQKAKASFVDNIKAELSLTPNQVLFPKSNPSIANTRMVVNVVFHKHPHTYISSACMYTINDLEQVQTDGKGGILDQKKLEAKQMGHLLANVRYFFWNFFRQYVNFKVSKSETQNSAA